MPSIISHAAVPLALGLGLGSKRIPVPLLVAGIAAAMLPDADVILFRLGARYESIWSHRGFAHSVGFALVLGLLAVPLLRKSAPPVLAFAFIACSAASHGLLDMMTNGGHGVAFLWPFSSERYFFEWRPVQVSPLDARRWIRHAGAVARTEAVWIWLPAIMVMAALRLFRREQQRRSDGDAPRLQRIARS